MTVPAPHFLLHSRTRADREQSHWSFSLKAADESVSLAVEDAEPDAAGERLELLAVVRGLEAIPSPSRLTLVTSSSYVNRVLDGGLDEWRASGWKWERHGEMVPVKNHDLWRRVDRALRFHQLHARRWRLDDSHACESSLASTAHQPRTKHSFCGTGARCSRHRTEQFAFQKFSSQSSEYRLPARKLLASVRIVRRRLRRIGHDIKTRLSLLGKAFAACP